MEQEANKVLDVIRPAIDSLWIIISSALVIFMQAGFLCVESGLTRAKNSINVAVKNIVDFGIASILFWMLGYGFMFGSSYHGFWGLDRFFLDFSAMSLKDGAFFLFQVAFCATATTIVSGAVAERMKFSSYLIVTVVISLLIYPLVGHWIWNGVDLLQQNGILAKRKFLDFAGSTVVHSVGGWVSLAAIIIIGPRMGRFGTDGTVNKINGHSLPLAMLGGVILWIGWIGFNGGSALALNDTVARIAINTMLAAASGLLVALFLSWVIDGYPEASASLNGSLAGLVSVTASCNVISPASALIIGAAGAVVMVVDRTLLKLKIDDAVGAIPVHLGAGTFGTLAVGLFGDLNLIGNGLSRVDQILAQLTGMGCVAAFAFLSSFGIFKLLNFFMPMRLSEEDERVGTNMAEHKASTEILDFSG